MRSWLVGASAVVLAGTIMAVAGWAARPATKAATGKLRHVVMFKFKDDAKPEDIQKVVDAFKQLPKQVPFIRGFEWGTNNSPEKLNQGFTHCFLLTFDSAKDRDAYLPHPAHKAFGKVLRPVIDKVMVIDFEAKE